MKPVKISEKVTAISPVVDLREFAADLQAVFDKHSIRRIKMTDESVLGYTGDEPDNFSMERCYIQGWWKPNSVIVEE